MTRPKHWQDPVNVVLGAWLLASPWVLGYQNEMTAVANAFLIGLALIAAALGAIFVPRAWEEWSEAVLGLWLVISPAVLDFASHRPAMLSAVVTGIVVVVLALWTLLTDQEYSAWWRKRTAR